jgi:molybdopterin converting factor small subunit
LRHGAVLFLMVNYERAKLSRVLDDGDTVSFISLVAGG